MQIEGLLHCKNNKIKNTYTSFETMGFFHNEKMQSVKLWVQNLYLCNKCDSKSVDELLKS